MTHRARIELKVAVWGGCLAPLAFLGYRAWAERHGGQIAGLAGEESWTLQHRYDRAFERLGLPGFGRPTR